MLTRELEQRLRERPKHPLRLAEYDSGALPDAAEWRNSLIACPDLGAPVFSDGTDWYPLTLGAAL